MDHDIYICNAIVDIVRADRHHALLTLWKELIKDKKQEMLKREYPGDREHLLELRNIMKKIPEYSFLQEQEHSVLLQQAVMSLAINLQSGKIIN